LSRSGGDAISPGFYPIRLLPLNLDPQDRFGPRVAHQLSATLLPQRFVRFLQHFLQPDQVLQRRTDACINPSVRHRESRHCTQEGRQRATRRNGTPEDIDSNPTAIPTRTVVRR
jgi:hypothetical protein